MELEPAINAIMCQNHNSTPTNSDYKTTTEEFDLDSYLLNYLGSKHRGNVESLTLTAVYLIVLVTGIIGNLATCAVIAKNSNMHTATNYYLFSLAVSDALALVLGLPPELYSVWEAYPWRFGQPYCLFKTFLTELVSSASILTITAFTVERYVAICHPLRAHALSRLSRAVKIIVGVWVLAALAALPYPLSARTFYYLHDPNTNEPILDSLVCNIPHEWMPVMKYVFGLSTLLLFVVPMCTMTGLYLIIGLTLRRSARPRTSAVFGRAVGRTRPGTFISVAGFHHIQSRRAVLRILVAVLVLFCICWAPFHAQRLMTVLIKEGNWTTTLIEIQSALFYISGILYYVSSTVNPILYNVMSYKYRRAFQETLCGKSRTVELRAERSGGPVSQFSTDFHTVSRGHGRYQPSRQSTDSTTSCQANIRLIVTADGCTKIIWPRGRCERVTFCKSPTTDFTTHAETETDFKENGIVTDLSYPGEIKRTRDAGVYWRACHDLVT